MAYDKRTCRDNLPEQQWRGVLGGYWLQFSTNKSLSMLYNLLKVGKAQMLIFDVVLDKNVVQIGHAD